MHGSKKLKTDFLEMVCDDATMAFMLVQFGTFQKLKEIFQVRYKKLREKYILLLEDADNDKRAKMLWQQYRVRARLK